MFAPHNIPSKKQLKQMCEYQNEALHVYMMGKR